MPKSSNLRKKQLIPNLKMLHLKKPNKKMPQRRKHLQKQITQKTRNLNRTSLTNKTNRTSKTTKRSKNPTTNNQTKSQIQTHQLRKHKKLQIKTLISQLQKANKNLKKIMLVRYCTRCQEILKRPRKCFLSLTVVSIRSLSMTIMRRRKNFCSILSSLVINIWRLLVRYYALF